MICSVSMALPTSDFTFAVSSVPRTAPATWAATSAISGASASVSAETVNAIPPGGPNDPPVALTEMLSEVGSSLREPLPEVVGDVVLVPRREFHSHGGAVGTLSGENVADGSDVRTGACDDRLHRFDIVGVEQFLDRGCLREDGFLRLAGPAFTVIVMTFSPAGGRNTTGSRGTRVRLATKAAPARPRVFHRFLSDQRRTGEYARASLVSDALFSG